MINYELLKNSLLKRFRLTEGGYSKRFKSVRIEVGEIAEQFVHRLKKYLTKWRVSEQRVSEQFLNGTSAHYRLLSARNGGQQQKKYVRIKSDIH